MITFLMGKFILFTLSLSVSLSLSLSLCLVPPRHTHSLACPAGSAVSHHRKNEWRRNFQFENFPHKSVVKSGQRLFQFFISIEEISFFNSSWGCNIFFKTNKKII